VRDDFKKRSYSKKKKKKTENGNGGRRETDEISEKSELIEEGATKKAEKGAGGNSAAINPMPKPIHEETCREKVNFFKKCSPPKVEIAGNRRKRE